MCTRLHMVLGVPLGPDILMVMRMGTGWISRTELTVILIQTALKLMDTPMDTAMGTLMTHVWMKVVHSQAALTLMGPTRRIRNRTRCIRPQRLTLRI
jgi:type IV secretory pathway VirB3-like protein